MTLRLTARAARALARPRVAARLVSHETGLKGDINTVALARVRTSFVEGSRARASVLASSLRASGGNAGPDLA